MAVTLPSSLFDRYPRFTLYNSPYAAHDDGCAIDLYPISGAPSPVEGEVVDVRTVRAPPKPYAPEHDHLIVIDDGTHLVRILHVDPTVEIGEYVEEGEQLGNTVRAGFFAPWVDDHLHVGVRPRGSDPVRASGSIRLRLPDDVHVTGLSWNGTGTVVETGDTYAVLDSPAHPAPGERFVGIAADDGGVLDGGVPHYDGGGLLGGASGPVRLLGTEIGTGDGRTVDWHDVTVVANGEPITGLSFFFARDGEFGAKLICPGHAFAIGDRVRVGFRSSTHD